MAQYSNHSKLGRCKLWLPSCLGPTFLYFCHNSASRYGRKTGCSQSRRAGQRDEKHGLQALAKTLFIVLIVAAIGIGNAAYESGNLTGAAIGLDAFVNIGIGTWASILGVIAIALLWTGSYQWIETVLVYLVFIMAGVFLVTLLVAKPDVSAMLSQMLSPRLDTDAITTVLALIGTTIVPYNLFLHASLVAKSSRGKIKLRQ